MRIEYESGAKLLTLPTERRICGHAAGFIVPRRITRHRLVRLSHSLLDAIVIKPRYIALNKECEYLNLSPHLMNLMGNVGWQILISNGVIFLKFWLHNQLSNSLQLSRERT